MDKSENIVEKVKELLELHQITYKLMEHEPTPTSIDAARVRGVSLEQGIKAIIIKLRDKNAENIMITLPGNRKIDSKKVRLHLKQDFSFENSEVIFQKYGVKIGGIPPFGKVFGLKMLVDNMIFQNARVDFNCGTQSKSIEIAGSDYLKIVENETLGDWSKLEAN